MKKLAIFTFAAISLVACKGETENNTDTDVVEEVVSIENSYTVDTENSKLSWKGTKPSEGEFHTGYVKFSEGKVETKDGSITSGNFVIDMNTISVTDLEEAKYKEKLENHLKGTKEGQEDHFFNVQKFPNVTVDVVSYDEGNLTIKMGILGQEVEETVLVELSEEDEASIKAAFEMDFSALKIPYLSPAEGEEKSKISPMIEFELDLKLKK